MQTFIYVRDPKGGPTKLIIRTLTDRKQILDKDGNLLGFIKDGSTFDKNGTLLVRGEVIGLLVK